jgi:hypothetical protein
MSLHLLAVDAERVNILGFAGELMFKPNSSHYDPTNGYVVGTKICE